MYKSEPNDTIIHIGDSRNIGFLDCILAGTTVVKPEESKNTRTVSEGYTFGYVVAGKGAMETENKRLPLSSDSFYFIGKGQRVSFMGEKSENSDSAPWETMWLQIDGTLAENLINTFRLGDLFTASVNVRRQFLEIHALLSHMETGTPSLSLQRISCLLFEILTEVRREEFFSSAGHVPSTAEAILTYLDNNIYNDLSLDLLTEHFGISKMHVIRLFKKEYDTTPMQYVMDKRISLAKSLLSGTVMPIREISELLRYSNSQHFSNSFSNAVGLSPNRYRKSKQQNIP